MSKFNSITIRSAMTEIANNRYLLPAIQRKFVWDSEQIEMLFDSIMREYPINSFMFWKICDDDIKRNYKFYSFIKDFTKRYNEDNVEAPTVFLNDFFAIIDGQQRMTSLYIGLGGTYRDKKPNKRWRNNEETMPTKRLYLDLNSKLESNIDNQKMYNFCFKSEQEVADDSAHAWFKVGDILNKDQAYVYAYLAGKELTSNSFAVSALTNLCNIINKEELINYCLIDEQDQDKVLDIFIRTNSGGTPLSFSDLLMSIASANWDKFDARNEMSKVRDEIRALGNPNFDVSQDFILKSILVLSDVDIRFRIDNFGKTNITIFESNWLNIKSSLIATFTLLEQLGFNDSILRAKNAAIPIAYYIYKNGLSEKIIKTTYDSDDKRNIAKWLIMSLLKGLFGGQSDSVLKILRSIIKDNIGKSFPLNEIIDAFKGNADKNYIFTDEIINSFIEEEYGSPICGLTLMLLYSDVVLQYGKAIAEDHMHPKVLFENDSKLAELNLSTEQIHFYQDKKNYNSVANLQLLEESKNKSKNDASLADWASKNPTTNLYVDPTTSLDIMDFEDFIKVRKENISKQLKRILDL